MASSFTVTNNTNHKIKSITISFKFKDNVTVLGQWSSGGDRIINPFEKKQTITLDSSNMRSEYFSDDVTLGNLEHIIYVIDGTNDYYFHKCDSKNETLDITKDRKSL